jgi:hypothetical protein
MEGSVVFLGLYSLQLVKAEGNASGKMWLIVAMSILDLFAAIVFFNTIVDKNWLYSTAVVSGSVNVLAIRYYFLKEMLLVEWLLKYIILLLHFLWLLFMSICAYSGSNAGVSLQWLNVCATISMCFSLLFKIFLLLMKQKP